MPLTCLALRVIPVRELMVWVNLMLLQGPGGDVCTNVISFSVHHHHQRDSRKSEGAGKGVCGRT